MSGQDESALGGGPPYPPQRQGLGETPSVIPDVPVCAVFLVLFIIGAVAHMTLFQVNKRKFGNKFAFNAAIFGFCFTRILATSLRMAWSYNQHNVSLALSAQIFVYAGTIILFISNLFFAQRIVRAQHPIFGWSKSFSIWLPVLVGLIVATILLLISAIVAQSYLTQQSVETWTRGIQLYGTTFFAICAFLPIPIVLVSAIAKAHPRNRDKPVDNFGIHSPSSSLRSKALIVIFSAIFLSLGAWYRAATSLLPPVAESNPYHPAYFSKACFYIFNFTIEISIVFFWLAIRIDKHYIIPNGAKGPHSYGNGFVFAGESGHQSRQQMVFRPEDRNSSSSGNINDRSIRTSTTTTTATTSDSIFELPATSPTTESGRTEPWRQPPTTFAAAAYSPTTTSTTPQKPHRVSWGGRSQQITAYDEDASELPREASAEMQRPLNVSGTSHELGYDAKSGKWIFRALDDGVYSAATNHTR